MSVTRCSSTFPSFIEVWMTAINYLRRCKLRQAAKSAELPKSSIRADALTDQVAMSSPNLTRGKENLRSALLTNCHRTMKTRRTVSLIRSETIPTLGEAVSSQIHPNTALNRRRKSTSCSIDSILSPIWRQNKSRNSAIKSQPSALVSKSDSNHRLTKRKLSILRRSSEC